MANTLLVTVEPLVGVARFERAASWTRTMHSTKLSHTPIQSREAQARSLLMLLYHSTLFLSTVF